MNTIQKSPIFFFTLITLLVASLAIPMVFASPITASTDQETYLAGDSLSVTGTATASAQVSIQIFDPSDIRKGVAQVEADDAGAFSASNIYTFTDTSDAGDWTVKAYDSIAGDTASVSIAVGHSALTSATIAIVPDKPIYSAEAITITISGNVPMSNVDIHVTQAGASQVTVASEQSVGDASKWGGTYMITAGNDGTATIYILASDASGNQVDATTTFATITGTASNTDIIELQDQVADLDAAVAGLEIDVSGLGFDDASLESDVAGLESDVAGIGSHTNVDGLKSDIASLKSDITALKNTANNIPSSVNEALVYGALIIGIIAIVISGVALARKK